MKETIKLWKAKYKRFIEVEIRTLTEFVKENPPRLIKMDIEGAELLALKGISEELIITILIL